ncbi:hypothetical protein GCM10025868_12280 [Angustibacter aerolatus]|uniref:Uncharacterized protein n=1 Tax=Angustibacter aerolatus TaxID=1162965 RepID=A0ABQ6JCT5_9ACTN|nr:hypothetical protein GCM10025868_12280 [Angustibacter aerolatus]
MVGTAYPARLDAALGVEPVDGVDQPDRADLHEVVERLAEVAVALREVAHEGQVRLDDAVAQHGALGVVRRQRDQSREVVRGLGAGVAAGVLGRDGAHPHEPVPPRTARRTQVVGSPSVTSEPEPSESTSASSTAQANADASGTARRGR